MLQLDVGVHQNKPVQASSVASTEQTEMLQIQHDHHHQYLEPYIVVKGKRMSEDEELQFRLPFSQPLFVVY